MSSKGWKITYISKWDGDYIDIIYNDRFKIYMLSFCLRAYLNYPTTYYFRWWSSIKLGFFTRGIIREYKRMEAIDRLNSKREQFKPILDKCN